MRFQHFLDGVWVPGGEERGTPLHMRINVFYHLLLDWPETSVVVRPSSLLIQLFLSFLSGLSFLLGFDCIVSLSKRFLDFFVSCCVSLSPLVRKNLHK